MKARSSLPSAVAFGLALAAVLAVSTSAHADEPSLATPELTPPETLPTHVLVHIESRKPVQLQSRAPGQKTWSVVCGVPCDQELPLGDEYRIAHGTKGPSSDKPFRLTPAADGSVMLKIHPASVGGKAGGGVLIGLGSVLGVIGIAGLAGGIAIASQPDEPCKTDWCVGGPALGSAVAIVGAIGLLLGAGMVAGGAAIIADSSPRTEQRPWAGREPVWVGPRAEAAPRKAGFVTPLSFAF